jgi:hypothetical protein
LAAARPADARRAAGKGAAAARTLSFEKDITPLFSQYCFGCHGEKKKGGLDLRVYTTAAAAIKDRAVFEKVLKNVSTHEMPPPNKPQPSLDERERITRWITAEVLKCDCDHPDPGRVTLRRLNKTEYNNTIRDLVGVDFQPADDFPDDDVGYGFDNIGDVLSLPPILLEKYLAAAEKILDRAIVTPDARQARGKRWPAEELEGTAPGGPLGGGARILGREGDIHVDYAFDRAGEYLLRARAWGQHAGNEPPRMTFSLGGKELKTFDVTAVENSPQLFEFKVNVAPGKQRFAAAYINNFRDPQNPDPNRRDRNLIIEWLEIVPPADATPPPLPASHQRIFCCQPAPTNKVDCARQILATFARRAYRRPVSDDEVGRLLTLFALAQQGGESFEGAVKVALQAVLVSPHFLFRGELQPEPDNPRAIHPVNEFALASRLSYFLWSTMPDDELFALAARGALRQNLDAQVRRLLKDPRSAALVENFAGQWLQTRNVMQMTPDRKQFPAYDDALRAAMMKETDLFFEHVLREDRSVLEFLDASYTFVNERLARHYGLAGVTGDQFQRVSLKGTPRGGVLTHASVLTITSNPTRTSPVKRGKWVLENILGAPPPPPPPDVPELKEGGPLTGTLRQRMEQHRENALCASCHARMDPLGFGFENFDAIGAWRDKDGEFPVDPSGQLVTGEHFKGPAELRAILLKRKKDDFVRCLAEKMLTYALGRGLEYYDTCAVDQVARHLAKNNYKFSALVLGIVKSAPFQMRRGEGEHTLARN